MKIFSQKNVVVVAVLILAAVLFWYSSPVQDAFYSFTTYLERLVGGHAAFGMLSFVVLAAISATVAPFSSIPLVPAAIILWGKLLAFLLLLLGWILGGALTYFLGSFAAYPAIKFFTLR